LLEYIAVVLIAAGIFLVVQGLRERYAFDDVYHSTYPEFDEEERMSMEKREKSEIHGGGVILIGPLPIVFGESKYAVVALILTIFLMILAILFMVMV